MGDGGASCPQPAHRGFHWRIWAAEAAATALLLLCVLSAAALDFGAGSPVADAVSSTSVRLLLTGVLVGASVALIAVSPLGKLAGGHLNPAVTLAFAVLGRVSRHDLAGYLVAQFTGALLGALAFHVLWGSVALSVRGGVTHPRVATPAALALEAGMTGLLVATIFLFVSRERLARWTPLAVWALLAVLIWKLSPYTGSSLNPARSEGPAFAFSDLPDLWIYFVGPLVGALGIALLWRGARPSMHPKTAKLFHDRRYACSLASDLPAMAPGRRMIPREV